MWAHDLFIHIMRPYYRIYHVLTKGGRRKRKRNEEKGGDGDSQSAMRRQRGLMNKESVVFKVKTNFLF